MAEKVSIRTSVAKGLHRFFLVGNLLYIFYIDQIVIPPRDSTAYIDRHNAGGKFKYLTFLNIIIFQAAFLVLAVINDIFGTNERSVNKISRLQHIRDMVFSTLTLPMALHVCTIFWGLFFYNRDFIYPFSQESWNPMWVCHFEHTFPMVVVLLEILLVYHRFPARTWAFVLPTFLVYVGYFCALMHLRVKEGVNTYGFFKEMNDVTLAAFLVVLGIPAFFWLGFGKFLHWVVWGSDYADKKKKGKQQQQQNAKQSDKKGNKKQQQQKQNGQIKKSKENQSGKKDNKKQKSPDPTNQVRQRQQQQQQQQKSKDSQQKKKQKNNENEKLKSNPKKGNNKNQEKSGKKNR